MRGKMKKILVLLVLLITATIIQGCAVAPVQSYNSAKSLGYGNNDIRLSGSMPALSYDRGVTENLDIGFGIENQDFWLAMIRGKYSILNQKNGLSFAVTGGLGYAADMGDSKSAYVGPILSYFNRSGTEFFVGYRLNYVHYSNNFKDVDTADIFSFFFREKNIYYTQLDLGVTFHGQKFYTTVGGKFLTAYGEHEFLPIVDFGIKF